jgi:DNA-directed RNA polymerase subunit RPC12/RpoP
MGEYIKKEEALKMIDCSLSLSEAYSRIAEMPEEQPMVDSRKGGTYDGHWRPMRYHCPMCGKQQKNSKYGVWFCERCGQKLCKEVRTDG